MKMIPQNSLLWALFSCCFTLSGSAQCPSGTIGISAGGCLSGCNLTAIGGPNCSPPVSGDAPSAITVTANIAVPAGCTYTVAATIRNRPNGCNSSGADNGDGLKVDISGGGKPFLTTSGNGTLNDSYTLTGPGTVVVSCRANRRDEVATYTVTSSGAACVNCMSVLPVELLGFNATKGTDYVDLDWITASERDNDYFTIERSADGFQFEPISMLEGAGTSVNPIHYTIRDLQPLEGTSYYRLKQTDFDGKTTYSDIRAVTFDFHSAAYPNPSDEQLTVTGQRLAEAEITVRNAIGQEVAVPIRLEDDRCMLDTKELANGLYCVIVRYRDEVMTHVVMVEHK